MTVPESVSPFSLLFSEESFLGKFRDCMSTSSYRLARFCMSPLWTTTNFCLDAVAFLKKSQHSTCQKVFEVLKVGLISSALLPCSVVGLLTGKVLHRAGFWMSRFPFIHVKGEGKGKDLSEKKVVVFQLNTSLTAGGFALPFGGLKLSQKVRVEKISQLIQQLNPDLVCLQEVSDLKSADRLCRALSKNYKHIYSNIGHTPFILQNNSGLFVASKMPMYNVEFQPLVGAKKVESMVNKGLFAFSTEYAHFINVHLSPSEEMQTIQQKQILEVAQKRFNEKKLPVVVLGDFNTDSGPLFERALSVSPEEEETFAQSDYLISTNWEGEQGEIKKETIDYAFILSQKPPGILTRGIPTFDLKQPEEALSDHPGLLTEITT